MKVEICGDAKPRVHFDELSPGDCFYGYNLDGCMTEKPMMKVGGQRPRMAVTPSGKLLTVPPDEWVVKLDASWVIHGAV
jgi:hypothetical protein